MSETKQELSENLKIAILFKKDGKDLNDPLKATLKLGEAMLKSGEAVMYDGEELVQGVAIAVQTPDGSFAPAPDGVLEFEDGTLVEVSGGLVANVKPVGVEAPEAAAPAQPIPMDQNKDALNPAQEAAVKRTIESIVKETHFSEAVAEIVKPLIPEAKETDLTEINAKLAKQDELITKQGEQIKALISLLESKPAEAPAKPVANAFKAVEEDADAKIFSYLKNL